MAALRSMASLNISSYAYTVDDISQILNTNPSRSNDIGTPISSVSSRLRPSALWVLKSPISETLSLDMHIEWLVLFIEAHQAEFVSLLSKSSADISCFYEQADEQGGFAISPELVERLGKQKLAIVVDIYKA